MYVDERLNWDKHVQEITSKLSKNIGILTKLKFTLPRNTLLMLYNSLILPYLTYCNTVWANCSATRLNSVLVLQKRPYVSLLRLIICLIQHICLNNLNCYLLMIYTNIMLHSLCFNLTEISCQLNLITFLLMSNLFITIVRDILYLDLWYHVVKQH